MSKELEISKKDKEFMLDNLSASEIVIARQIAKRRKSQKDIGLAARKFPPIMNRDGSPVLNADGTQKYADEKGWTLKINNKTKELCGFSCKEIDNVEDVILSDWILSVRQKVVRMCEKFIFGLEVLFIDEYEKFKNRVDDVIEFSWHSFQTEVKELERV